MPYQLLQIDFPSAGPWGREMSVGYEGLAEVIGETPGLIWKIWTENPVTGEAGGIYLFSNEEKLAAYLTEHTERLKSFGITDIRAKKFEVNEPLTQLTRGKLE
jgi:hypothetical protein